MGIFLCNYFYCSYTIVISFYIHLYHTNIYFAVVSSKDQSPEAVSVALARLKQLEGHPTRYY